MAKNLTNFQLAPGEQNVYGDSFITSLATAYLKTELMCSSTRFVYKNPNTLLGLIPLGGSENVIPIRQIAAVSTNRKIYLWRALLGVILTLTGFGGMFDNFGMIFMLILGVLLLLMCFPSELKVTNPAGGTTAITVSMFDANKLEAFKAELQNRVFADQSQIQHDEAQSMRAMQAQISQQQLLIQQQQMQQQNNSQQGNQDPTVPLNGN